LKKSRAYTNEDLLHLISQIPVPNALEDRNMGDGYRGITRYTSTGFRLVG